MSRAVTSSRPFEPGTTGWTVRDLDDPMIEREWLRGRYEIVEGVLTQAPPAYFAGGNSLFNLLYQLKKFLEANGPVARFATEVDVVIAEDRVARADAVMMLSIDEAQQAAAFRASGRKDPDRTRLLVPPTLIIESVSPGHEQHDLKVKRNWYAEFGIQHYWILDGYKKSLEALVLEGTAYQVATVARDAEGFQTPLFAGLVIALPKIWKD